MSNGCPVCLGLGRILAFGAATQPVSVPCPECAGLAITPASADEGPSVSDTEEAAADRNDA